MLTPALQLIILKLLRLYQQPYVKLEVKNSNAGKILIYIFGSYLINICGIFCNLNEYSTYNFATTQSLQHWFE